MIKHLRAANVAVISASEVAPDAPAFCDFSVSKETSSDASHIALLAINDTDPRLTDRQRLAHVIAAACGKTNFVIALVHWGEEDTAVVTEEQRELARWLIDHGVDLIAGSHPHCIQPLDFYHGRPVVYSLGNLVFDGAPTVAQWSSGNLLEIGFAPRDVSPSLRLVPIRVDANGLPHLVPLGATAQR